LPVAFTAMRFIFDEHVSGLNEYAAWLDFDPGQFRAKLLATMKDSSALEINGFNSMQRRNFRYNYSHWKKIHDTGLFLEPEEAEEE
jgi:hypothetical protein